MRDSRDSVTNAPVEQTAKVFLFDGPCKKLMNEKEARVQTPQKICIKLVK